MTTGIPVTEREVFRFTTPSTVHRSVCPTQCAHIRLEPEGAGLPRSSSVDNSNESKAHHMSHSRLFVNGLQAELCDGPNPRGESKSHETKATFTG